MIDDGDPDVWKEGEGSPDAGEFKMALNTLYVDQGRSGDFLALERALSERLAGEVNQHGDQAQEVVDVFVSEVSYLTQIRPLRALQVVSGDEEAGLKFALGCVRKALGIVGNTLGEYRAMTNGIPAKVRESTEKVDGLGRIMEIQAGMIRDLREVLEREGVDVSQLREKWGPDFAEAQALFAKIDPKKESAFAAGLGDGGWEG